MPRKSKSMKMAVDTASAEEDGISDHWYQAAIKREKQHLYKLIQSGADLNKKQSNLQITPIYSAIMSEDIPLIKLMVSKGAKLDVTGANQFTPLAAGVSSGNVDVVKCLLDLGANIRTKCCDKNDSVLHMAAEVGNVSIVKLLLDRGLDVNVRNNQAETALHSAVVYNKIELVKVLIERGADVNAKSSTISKMDGEEIELGTNVTPVFLASLYGHVNIVCILIKAGANVNIKTSTQYTALHPAAQEGPLALVKMLIEAKIDVNVKSRIGRSALSLAAKTGQVKIVETLLNVKGIEINSVGQQKETPLMLAATNGHLEVVKLLVAKGAPFNEVGSFGRTPLMASLIENRENVAIWLLKNGANIGSQCKDFTILHTACVTGSSVALIKLLIDKGCDVNAKGYDGSTPVLLAAKGESADGKTQKDNVDIVRYLISRGADPNQSCIRDRTPLHHAAKNGWTKTVEYLVTVVEDINPLTVLGVTPLLMAAIEGHHEIVEILLKNGADPSIQDLAGQTPMDMAANNRHTKTVDILLKYCTDVNNSTGQKQTPLFSAADTNNIQMATSLLQKGAAVNAQDESNQTPLHIAAGRGYHEMVKLFLKYGANANIKIKGKGYSALYIAVKFKFQNVVETLLECGADVNTTDKYGVLPIHIAAQTLSMEMVKILLHHGAYYNVKACAKKCKGPPIKFARKANDLKLITALELIKNLFTAVGKNDSYQIECCVQAGAIVNARNADGKTVLHNAVSSENIEAINLLLKHNANVALASNSGSLPLHLAAISGNKEIVNILLTHAKDLDFPKRNNVINARTTEDCATALHMAAEKNYLPIVQLLLQNGAVYNMKNKAGITPINLSTDETVQSLFKLAEKLFAVMRNDDVSTEDLAQILEQEKSVINARDSSGGGTLLYWSASKGYKDIVNFLLNNGADCHLVTNKGTSPLHITASKGYTEITRAILNHMMKEGPEKISIFVDAVTASGTAPLHVSSNKEIVYCLLQAGATYNVQNRDGKTTLELTKHDYIQKLLKTTHQFFEDTKKGDPLVMSKLNNLDLEECKAILGTRNKQGQTLLQVALSSAHTTIATELSVKMESLN